jgi:hypothetical protein
MDHKRDEIKEHFKDFLRENSESILDGRLHLDDIHHEAFNSDYYMIGRYQAEQWLGDQTFEIIQYIIDWEMSDLDCQYLMHRDVGTNPFTDLTDPEKVVNLYAYIVGEQIVNDWREEFEHTSMDSDDLVLQAV